jgi:serine/threonine protein kinase
MSLIERSLDAAGRLLGGFELDGRTITLWFLLVLAIYFAAQLFVFLCLLAVGRARLAKCCHPDHFPKGSVLREWADRLYHWLNASTEPVAATPHQMVGATRTYALAGRLATGDLCDVYSAVSDGRIYVLKVPRVTGHGHLLAKERRVLEQLIEQSGGDLYGEYFPWPVDTFRIDDRRVNAFEWRDGFFTAEQILRRYPQGLDGRHLAWMFKRTLEALGYAHNNAWIHGAVLPPHLLFHAEKHGLKLVGWIHAGRPNRPLQVAPQRFKSWYPPECHGRRPAGPSTDIYLAAKSMMFLAGGDPRGGAIPTRIPVEIRRFLNGCLLESPGMRPQDAWQLHDEFTALLEDLYGPPQYHHLEMY